MFNNQQVFLGYLHFVARSLFLSLGLSVDPFMAIQTEKLNEMIDTTHFNFNNSNTDMHIYCPQMCCQTKHKWIMKNGVAYAHIK